MSLLTTVKGLLGSAWHVNSDAALAALLPATDGTVEASKLIGADANKDVTGLRNLALTGTITQGDNSAAEAAPVKGRYLSASIAVAVPTIANDAAENVDSVAVDVSAMTFAPAVGDSVIAIPLEALPTDCLMCGAYVTATDTVTVTFGSKEAGGGVTGANKNFKFLFDDLT